VGEESFNKTIQFVNEVVGVLPDRPGEVNVAGMMFHSKPLPQFDFNDNSDIGGIQDSFSNFVYDSSRSFGTAIGAALDFATDTLLTPEAGHRENVQTIVFVMTDGKSQETDEVVAEAAGRLLGATDSIIALGITDAVDPEQLSVIAGGPAQRFLLNDFDALGPQVIATIGFAALCNAEPTTSATTSTLSTKAKTTATTTTTTTTSNTDPFEAGDANQDRRVDSDDRTQVCLPIHLLAVISLGAKCTSFPLLESFLVV